MNPSLPKLVLAGPPEVLNVILDGCIIGTILSGQVEKVVDYLRRLKVSSTAVVLLFHLPCFFPFILCYLLYINFRNIF